MYGVIYTLIDGINDKEYIGQTVRPVEVRFKQHAKTDSYIGRAIRAHGEDMFSIVVLKECESKEELDYWEKHFIKSRNTKSPNGYNLTGGGERNSGEDNPFYGKHHTAEVLAKISATNKGNKYWLGRHHSKETLAKMCAIPKSPEARLNMSIAKRNITPFKNLLAEMDNQNLTYTALAKLIGLPQASFSQKMYGKYNFTAKDIIQLVEIFNKPAEYLMERDDGEEFLMSKRHDSPFKNLSIEIDKHNLTYTALANLLGLSQATVSEKMHDKLNFTAKDIAKLEEIFGLPAEYLLKRD
ncbi:MAG: GIY-YIG nuclease family protein [Selenomonadaceae bacterium]|nr:GIY-YIG nuclease family protein [Selenomonadaceae bacterium]